GLVAIGRERRVSRWAVGLAALALSLAVPSGDLVRTEQAAALTSLVDVHRKGGALTLAEATARRATEIDPSNAVAWFNYGVVLRAEGRDGEAEKAYREALRADPLQPDAAANLGGILVASGRQAEAIPVLEAALAAWPRHAVGWTNLVVAYA